MKTITVILISLLVVLAGIDLLRTARFTSRQIQLPASPALPSRA